MPSTIGLAVSLAFAAGVLFTQLLPDLPGIPLLAFLTILALSFVKSCSPLSAFLFAMVYTSVHGYVATENKLPEEYEMKDLIAEGVIVALPERGRDRSKFNLDIDTLNADQGRVAFNGVVRLSWYGKNRPRLSVGERWSLKVRLKRPWGTLNPGVFDYQGWLWRQGIQATGYVRFSTKNEILGSTPSCCRIDRMRQRIRDQLIEALPIESAALIAALTIGDRSLFSKRQWEQFRQTGTNHLVAISGLHVGLVAGMLFVLVRGLWRRFPRMCLLWASIRAASLAAIIGAILYAALAGFSVSAQRACIMVVAFLLPTIFGRQLRPANGLGLAIVAVLLIDPRSILSVGYLLSFTAVAAILWGLHARTRGGNYVTGLLKLQWVIMLIMLPLSLMLFNQSSLLAFPVNLLAIPWFSFILGNCSPPDHSSI